MGFLVGFLEKGTKSANLGNFGVLRRGVGIPRTTLRHGMSTPRRDRGGGLYKAWVRRGIANLHHSEGLRRSIALFTDRCFCHDLLFRYSEDLSIGQMRTL